MVITTIPSRLFVAVWQSSDSIDEACDTLCSIIGDDISHDDMQSFKRHMNMRACYYRSCGVKLKKFSTGV
jgi:hypothetical protein